MDILIEEFEGSLWAAALTKGRLQGLEVDPVYEQVRWGSIYWAQVKSIDASLDAAYLDLDGENIGLIYNKDLRFQKSGVVIKGGNVAIGKSIKPGQMIAVQAKQAYLPGPNDPFLRPERKIPQMSMDITLPGRYLIFCVFMETNRISTRIRDKKMRKQLGNMLKKLDGIQGCILRAASVNTQTDLLTREGKILQSAWEQMQARMSGETPQVVMQGPDAVQRILSDHASQFIERIEVVTMEHFNYAEEWCTVFAPDLVTRIDPVELPDATDDLALFHYRDIMGQIEDLFQPYILLPGGGNIIIQETAALTAIDVNKGGDKSAHISVNLEAAIEALRQLRLRNIGGAIVIDFLKFQNANEEKTVLEALSQESLKDACTIQIHGKTGLGLVEISRNRRTPSLNERHDADIF